jgi:LPXTG-site transpeptidase (sortase) family protein
MKFSKLVATILTLALILSAMPAQPAYAAIGDPTIEKEFSPATITVGEVSTLTFTIENTNLGTGWLTELNFTDTYPAGLVNTTPLNVSGNCNAVTYTAAAGGNSFNLTSAWIDAESTCTITVDVTATTAGTKNNTTGFISSTESGVGTDDAAATLTVLLACPTPLEISDFDELSDCIDWANTIAGANTLGLDADITLSDELPSIETEIIINGGGFFIDGSESYVIFNVTAPGNLTVDNLIIRYGNSGAGDGGGIRNFGTVTITDSTLTGNFSTASGGGIYNAGTLTVTDSTLYSNISTTGGGGIYNEGTLTIDNCTISNNEARVDGGGGIYNLETLSIANSTISGNKTTGDGGGVNNKGTMDVESSTFSENLAIGDYHYGGGIHNENLITSIENSTFSGNSAYWGGGINNNYGTITNIINSTFSGNSAIVFGGGINNYYAYITTMANTIIANNTGNNCDFRAPTTSINNLTDSAGCNWTAESWANTSLNPAIHLGPLANNGGPTKTHALLFTTPSNPAIDNCGAGATTLDQRGVARPQGTQCDIGAYEYDNTMPFVVSTSLADSYVFQGPSTFTVTFSENLNNAGGGSDTHDVENPGNYLLVEEGTTVGFQTIACSSPDFANDTQITVDSVDFNSSNYTSTLMINGGTPLPVGNYRLFICATTTLIDLAGIELGSGEDDEIFNFVVAESVASESVASSLPETGFAQGIFTTIPVQPASRAYTSSGMTLEIPSLGASMDIVGVPQSKSSWDVTWLGESAGYLAGSAFPTWEGNTVLTGHVWDANNAPGPFAEIKNLQHGDTIEIEAWGLTYTYEVRENKVILPNSVDTVFEHEDYDWVTLVTCEFYNPFSGNYIFRRMVRAVLVDVGP